MVLTVLVPGVAWMVVFAVQIGRRGAVVTGSSAGAAVMLAIPEGGGEIAGGHRRTLWNERNISALLFTD